MSRFMKLMSGQMKTIREERPKVVTESKIDKDKRETSGPIDSFVEVIARVDSLEEALRGLIITLEESSEEKYLNKSGEMTDDEFAIFRDNTGLITLDEVPESSGMKQTTLDLDSHSNSNDAGFTNDNVIDVRVKYPDGSSGNIKYFTIRDGIFHAYNHFEGDLAGRPVIVTHT